MKFTMICRYQDHLRPVCSACLKMHKLKVEKIRNEENL